MMTESIRYPLLFEPLFDVGDGRDDMLRAYLSGSGVELPSGMACSWELIDAPPCSSRVSYGPAAGRTLSDLTREWGTELVGRRYRPGQAFPVCTRVLQTAKSEPLVVHPEKPARPDVGSNTKFWYSLNAEPDAVVITGIHPTATRMGFLAQLNTPMLRQSLQVFHPERCDAFLAPAGRVHALGAGNLVFEVQEHLAGALCVSGWGPEDAVPLNAATAALDQVLFSDRQVRRISQDAGPIRQTRKVPLLPQCPAFRVDEIRLCDSIASRTVGASFHLFSVVEGRVRVICRQEGPEVPAGRGVLVPASVGDYRIETIAPQSRLLKIGLPE